MDDNGTVFIVGCGDIGHRVARMELEAGHRVGALARSDIRAVQLRELGLDVVRGDLDRPETLPGLPSQTSIIYYFAPPPSAGNSDPRLAALLSAIDDADLPERIVYISTSGVYGDCGGSWIDENHPLTPVTDRAKRRVAAETLVNEWAALKGVRRVILRVPGIYGPGRLPFERIRLGRPVVLESESPYSNRIHADDLATACYQAAHERGAEGAYNVSDGHPTTMTDYFNRVADLAGLPRPPQVSMAEARTSFDPGTLSFLEESKRLDNRKMLRELQVRLRYPSLTEGLLTCR
jgi:nucleoside-diphosphate-sugar epimerase